MIDAPMKLKIVPKPHFGFRVINEHGEAELGTYHIADFAWETHANFFVNAVNALLPAKG